MEAIEILRRVLVGKTQQGFRPSKVRGSTRTVRNMVDLFTIRAYRPAKNRAGVWRWVVVRTIADGVVLEGENAKYADLPIGGLQNVPLSYFALRLAGLVDPSTDEVDWRPTETVPEDYYGLGVC